MGRNKEGMGEGSVDRRRDIKWNECVMRKLLIGIHIFIVLVMKCGNSMEYSHRVLIIFSLQVVIFLTEKGELGEAILDLEKNELLVLLQFTVKWNTNTKNSHVRDLSSNLRLDPSSKYLAEICLLSLMSPYHLSSRDSQV